MGGHLGVGAERARCAQGSNIETGDLPRFSARPAHAAGQDIQLSFPQLQEARRIGINSTPQVHRERTLRLP